jgi:DNA polymerase elongation subunit (family B)
MTKTNLKTKRRRLFFDIETSPNIGLFWEAGYKKNITTDNIIRERAIICICYKWEDEKEVYALQWDAKQNDKRMLEQFIAVANTANELVGHNGDKFDLAWIRTRCLFHGIDMFPNYQTIDTLKVARSKFRFQSNRLNYIAEFLGLGGKIKTEFNLWKDILLNKDKVAMEKMIKASSHNP